MYLDKFSIGNQMSDIFTVIRFIVGERAGGKSFLRMRSRLLSERREPIFTLTHAMTAKWSQMQNDR
jgi:hypothetical protein